MSSVFSCWWWWLLLGALLGWLLSWWFSRNTHKQTNSSWASRFADVEGRHSATLRQKDTEITRLQSEYGVLKARPLPAAEIKIVEKFVDRPVDRIVEKVVNVPVDNPDHLIRIRALEAEAGMIVGLRAQLGTLQSAPPKIVEKIVDRPVDRVVERIVEKIVDRPVDRIVERLVDRPVDRIVEKVVNVQVDNPQHLGRIRELEAEVGQIGGLRSQIGLLQLAAPTIVERIVDRPVDRIIERIVDRPVDRIVEKIVDRPVDRVVEKLVPDIRGLEERDRHISELRLRIESLERSNAATIKQHEVDLRALREARPVLLDKAAAKAAGFNVRGMDDLEVVEGIGPKIAELLNADGIHYFSELAQVSQARIQGVLDRAGPNFRLAKPDTWSQQASLAAANRWVELRTLQDQLNAGSRT